MVEENFPEVPAFGEVQLELHLRSEGDVPPEVAPAVYTHVDGIFEGLSPVYISLVPGRFVWR